MARTKQPESVKILEYFNTVDIAVAREVLALATAAVKSRGPRPQRQATSNKNEVKLVEPAVATV